MNQAAVLQQWWDSLDDFLEGSATPEDAPASAANPQAAADPTPTAGPEPDPLSYADPTAQPPTEDVKP